MAAGTAREFRNGRRLGRVRGQGDGWCTVRTLENGNGCAHRWGVCDSQKVAGLDFGRATDGEKLSPLSGEMFFGKKKVRLEQHFHDIVA